VTLIPRNQIIESRTTEKSLVAIAERDEWADGRYSLAAGPLVLADLSAVGIDDAHILGDKIMDELLGPMEHQEKAIHVAGINATLKTRNTIFFTANPKGGRFQKDDIASGRPLIELLDKKFTTPFLDRIDWFGVIMDTPDPERDTAIVKTKLDYLRGEVEPEIDHSLLQKYIIYVRSAFTPAIGADMYEAMTRPYLDKRGPYGGQFTIRNFNSIIRFAQASAKLRMSNVVEKVDIDVAYSLVQDSLKTVTAERGEDWDQEAYLTRMSKTERGKIEVLMDMFKSGQEFTILEIKEKLDPMIPDVERYVDKASEQGLIYMNKGSWRKV
jgi:replicative DNA helicase Mcm